MMNKFITVHSENGKNRSMVNTDFIVSVVEYEGKNYLTVKGIENPAIIDENISQVQQLMYAQSGTSMPAANNSQPTNIYAPIMAAPPPVVDESITGPS
jgi:hypothetical protein